MELNEKDGRGMQAPNPAAAVIDARERNAANKALWAASKIKLSEDLAVLVAAAHDGTVYTNLREKFIAVKASGYRPRDKARPAYQTLVKFCEKHNITASITTGKAAIYRIK